MSYRKRFDERALFRVPVGQSAEIPDLPFHREALQRPRQGGNRSHRPNEQLKGLFSTNAELRSIAEENATFGRSGLATRR
ncbi:hypothetical protein [Rhodovulum sulfidophilum]|uniref:hypothetical protein n=1 Tax=Rhodovulum sulfidophilum TaxID=35806 RepID=UPI00138A0279|nr:hypothetical protein [Rhodovulum sulfidophilum]NDK36347.1 hypothetical protein [Rhodovulum sulfidophilum]